MAVSGALFRRPMTGRLPLLLVDPRPYRHRAGQFLIADRVVVGDTWTPLVRVRFRRPRAGDGGTEL
jgi:hypothetical protein